MKSLQPESENKPGPTPAGGPARSSRPAEQGAWRDLFAELATGRPEAFETLYDAAAKRLYGLALWRTGHHDDAEDVLQEVFVKVAQTRRELPSVRDPLAWLLTLTRRAAIDLVRRRAVRHTEELDRATELVSALDPTEALMASEVSRGLAALPAPQREVLYLHHFTGRSFREIGSILSIPTFTAASRYRRGLARLKKQLDPRAGGER